MKKASAQLRVSTTGQFETGDSPDRQKKDIIEKARSFEINGIEMHISPEEIEFITLHESASVELKKQPFQRVIEWHKNNSQASVHFVSKIDRNTRGGGKMFFNFKDTLSEMTVSVVDAEGIIGNKIINPFEKYGKNYPVFNYDPTEENQWDKAQRAQSYIRESIGNATRAGMEYLYAGYWFTGSPTGYEKVRVETEDHGQRLILVKDNSKQAEWIIKMYELRALGNIPDDKIVKELNDMGYGTRELNRRDKVTRKVIGKIGGNPLTEKSLLYVIENPINAGIICNERINMKAVIGKRFVPLVNVELWNKANRGKNEIIIDGEDVVILWDKKPDYLLNKNWNNPLYAHRKQFKCHILLEDGSMCGHPLKGSAPPNKRGIHIPRFHCSHNHKWWSVNKEIFDRVLLNFVCQIKLNEGFKIHFKAYALEEIYKRRIIAIDTSTQYQDRVSELTKQKANLAKNLATIMKEEEIDLELVSDMRREYNRIREEIVEAKKNRAEVEKEEIDIERLIDHCYYLMDHLKELLFTEDKPFQNADMFGLLFAESPTFKDLWNGTPHLDPIFELNESFSKISLQDLVKSKNEKDRTPYFRSISKLISDLEEPKTSTDKTSVPRAGLEPA